MASSPGRVLAYTVVAFGLVAAACGSDRSGPDRSSEEPWDYVALGDSWTGFASWPEMYVDFMEEDLGIEVVLHDESRPSQRADDALDRIRTDGRLRELLAGAEVITVGIVGNEFGDHMRAFVNDDGTCGGVDNQDCLREGLASMEADFEAMLNELVALRSPNEAIITTFTKGVMLAERACGGWGNECWRVLAGHFIDMAEFVKEAAEERGIRLADALPVLHAPGVYEAPINEDYVVDDRVHFTDEGSAVVATVLRDLGYD